MSTEPFNCGPNSSITVFPSPHAALANSEAGQDEKALNDTSSITQHDRTDCEQFGGVVGSGLTEPNNSDEVCNESVEDATNANGEKFCTKTPYQPNCHRVEFSPMIHPKGRHV